jgi:photosystem II stability/assembly factor-like uncharacterized protein
MKQIKFLIFILLAITIFSCYSINTVCEPGEPIPPEPPDIIEQGDIIWEIVGGLPYSVNWRIKVESNGNIWAHDDSEFYLSIDNGDTWIKKGKVPFSAIVNVSPVNGYIFAVSVDLEVVGLFRSTDNGENWEHIIEGIYISRYMLFTASGEIYITGTKLEEQYVVCYYSNDNGNTWVEKSKSSGLPSSFVLSALGKDGTLYAQGVRSGLWRSTDGGVTWLPPSNYSNVNLGTWVATCDDGSVFVLLNEGIILKSTDKGVNWTEVNTGFDFNFVTLIIYNPVTKDIFVNAKRRVSKYYNEVYRSTDLGESWILENSGLPNEAQYYHTAVNPNTGQMFITVENGAVYRTKNYPK